MVKKQRIKRSTDRFKIICKECGKEFLVCNCFKDKRKYCSRECASRNYQRTRINHRIVTKKCAYCGEEFTRKVAKSKHEPIYCSTDCANRHRVVKLKAK